jgi:hypothetical protein
MTRILFVAAVVSLVGTGLPRQAEAQIIRAGVAAGPTIPVGDLADVASIGFHAQGMLGLRIPLLPVSFRGELLFQRLPFDPGGNFQQFAGIANVLYTLAPTPVVSPYLIGGLGVYNSGNGASSTDFGVNGGVGIRVNLLVVDLLGEARFHHAFTDGGSSTLPISFGVMF